ncbi:conserved hypothetical protein [Ricinus communis]|uniref:Squalene monooxygenase n=1 Tax=Ricinus communis TaxID=3988 RepID=B9S7X0_RICCO|nr:conserved hypothetical protein [Ricinus communis]
MLCSLKRKKNITRASLNNCTDETLKSSSKEICQPEIAASPDIIIVGAGVAGAALAYALGKDGRQVHVIERDLNEPDRIVGELLQPGSYLKLIELGLEDCVEKIDAQQVFGYAIFKDGKESNVSGRSFHNGRFIQRMKEKAASLPNLILQQGTVTSLVEKKGTVKGAEIPSCFVALVLENCDLPYASHGHVIPADPSPILFYPISSTEVRCLVDIPGQNVPSISNGELAQYLKGTVAKQIPSELHDAFISAIGKGNIRTMPNRSMPASPHPTPGALLLGDAFNTRHPLTGGMIGTF